MAEKRNRNKWRNPIEKAQKAAQDAGNSVGDAVESVRDLPPSNVLGSVSSAAPDAVSGAASGAVSGVVGAASGASDAVSAAIGDKVADVAGSVTGSVTGATSRVTDAAKNVAGASDVADVASRSVSSAKDVAAGAASQISSGVAGTGAAVTGAASDMRDAASRAVISGVARAGDVADATQVDRAVKVDRADAAVSRNTGAVRSTSKSTTTTERVVWEPRPYPKWWLVVPSVAGVVGLVAWQMNGIRNKQEDDLEKRSLVALRKKFPKAGLEFKGRDATLRGLTVSERAEAEKIVRNIKGVRAVTVDDKTPSVVPKPSVITTNAPALPETTLGISTEAPASATEDTFAEPPAGPSTTVPDTAPSDIATPTVADAVPEKSIPETDTSEVANDTAVPTTAEVVTTTTAVPRPNASGETTTTVDAPNSPAAPAAPIESAPSMQTISFASSSSVLGINGTDLQGLADFLVANPDARIAVSGHADSSGTRIGNLALSQERADAVRDALIRLGVDPAQITAKGFGSRSPITSNDTFAGRTKNRRVELRIVGARDNVNFTG